MKLGTVIFLVLCVMLILAKKKKEKGDKSKSGDKHKARDRPTSQEILERRANATNTRSYYTCTDGDEIPDSWVCDLESDCSDGADEDGCDAFTCYNGKPIPYSWVCDGDNDCDDAEDEDGCSDSLTCYNGETIPYSWVCDGENDCDDAGDEDGCSATCGQTPIPPMGDVASIVGGVTAVPYSWPWQVALVTYPDYSFLCGGSVIDNQWVLTAAHCFKYNLDILTSPENYGVRVALFDRWNNDDGQGISLASAIPHPYYNSYNKQNDIALLKLSSPITYSDKVQPICLPSNDGSELNAGNKVTVTGWGTTSYGGYSSDTLQQVSVDMVSYSDCNSQYGYIVDSMMICAAAPGKDSCQGDSGGPFVRKTGDNWYQYGVVSFGRECALATHSGVYTRVSNYCSWIQQTTGKNLCS